MFIRKMLIVFFLSPNIFTVFSDVIIFQTDFNDLPDNWLADQRWEFGPYGAEVQVSGPVSSWDPYMHTGSGAPEPIYFVPDGTDSLIVTIPYYINAIVQEGYAEFKIRVGGSSSGWHEIWSEFLYSGEAINEVGTINISPDWIVGGEWVGIDFEGYSNTSETGYLNALWRISSLTLTAIGDSLVLDNITWAKIKSALE